MTSKIHNSHPYEVYQMSSVPYSKNTECAAEWAFTQVALMLR